MDSPAPDDGDQPAKKRQRLSQTRVDGETDTAEPMELANGNAASAHRQDDDRVGPRKLIPRVEYIRLLEQALSQLGFDGAARHLEQESGIALEAPEIGRLRTSVLAGDFAEAVQLLGQLPLSDYEYRRAEFALLEQNFLEALEGRDVHGSVICLRKQLAKSRAKPERLHRLAACILCATPEELRRAANWPGAGPASRQRVIEELQALLPAQVMVAGRRLEALLEQAIDAQLRRCMFHNNHRVAVSLLTDYVAGAEQIPTRTVQVLTDHQDEVWHLQFAHRGHMLASASKDGTAIVWDIGGPRRRVERRRVLRAHAGPVVFVAWSPDDSKLATCGTDTTLRIWEPLAGTCLQVVKAHSSEVSAMVWMPDGLSIITGSHDRHLVNCTRVACQRLYAATAIPENLKPQSAAPTPSSQLTGTYVGTPSRLVLDGAQYQHSVDGKLLRTWNGHQINDLALTADGRFLLATPSNGNLARVEKLASVKVYSLHAPVPVERLITAPTAIISISLASDSRHLLVHMSNGNISLWELPADLNQPMPKDPVKSYVRKRQPERTGHWIVRSCFGGCNESFVLSGSEECKVYVWHRGSGELLAELEGHSGTVNAVHWNPAVDSMFASASDDRSIHIWGLVDDVGTMANGT